MNNCKLEGRRGCQDMASVCLLCCPIFLRLFLSFADALPWVCWGEPRAPSPLGSPCSCQGREAQKLPVSALWRQLMAQPCFRNSCSATGAGRGWALCCCFRGDWWEFRNFYRLHWGVTERDPPQTRFEGSAAFSCPV